MRLHVRWTGRALVLALGACGAPAMGPEGDAASVLADAVTAADAQLDPDTSPPDAALPPVPRLAVLDQLAFTREVTPGVAPGFDLDARQSDARDAASCFKPDYMSPEGVPGIDNQLAGLVPLLDAFGLGAVEGLVQGSIKEGGLLILLELDGVDDPVNDTRVGLRLRLGRGTPLLGTDGLLLSGQTFHLHPDTADTPAPNGRIEEGVLTAGPFDIRMPIVVFGVEYSLPIYGTQLRAALTYDGGLAQGLLGGAVKVEDVIAIATRANMNAGGVLDAVSVILNGRGDLEQDADGACRAISGAFGFSAVSAFLFDE